MGWSWLLMIFGVWASTAWAAVPEQLHYNGYLTNAVGEGVDCPDALQCAEAFNLTFRLYDAEDSDAALWEETHEAVVLYGGSFHAALGSLNPITPETVNGPTWLAIQINDQPEMEPRQKIVSSAYALRAGSAEHAAEALNATQLGGINAADYATQEAVTEIESSLAPVATAGLPEELSDGDDDTLAALGCVAGQIPKWDGTAWACAEDVDTDTSIDDTTLDEAQVDAMVANNGYASEGSVTDVQATLANVQNDLNNAQAALTTLQGNLDATGVTVNDHGVNITALQAELNQLQSNLTLVQANLDAEALTRSDADTSLNQAITDEAVQRIADDAALQGQVDAVAADLNSTVTGLAVVATTGSYTDLSNTPTDSDTLSWLECETGQLPKWDGSAWACAEDTNTTIADTNTQLTEAEVDAFVANNGFALAAAIITSESDPQVGAVTSGKQCRGDGGQVQCDHNGHVTGGLYGICQYVSHYGAPKCTGPYWPAYCTEPSPPSTATFCLCPVGYTRVTTGYNSDNLSAIPATWFACYKN